MQNPIPNLNPNNEKFNINSRRAAKSEPGHRRDINARTMRRKADKNKNKRSKKGKQK
jgi:hypothetical protein